MKTTLNKIREHFPCAHGWAKLLKHLGKTQADYEPLAITTVLDSNGIDDALWCLRAVKGHDREIRLYAVWCARQVQHLMTDPRSLSAIDVTERYANGQATDKELVAAKAAAWWTTAGAAAWAAARAAAWEAARDAAAAGAEAAAAAGAEAAAGEWASVKVAAREAARVAARVAQAAELRRVCDEIAAQKGKP